MTFKILWWKSTGHLDQLIAELLVRLLNEVRLLSLNQKTEDFKTLWRSFEDELPILFKDSKKYNTACSSSVPSESCFN